MQIMETLKKRSSIAIQDDRAAWNKSGHKRSSGKLLLVDQADYNTQHIFFDDAVTADESCQVDVVDVVTGTPLTLKKSLNKYLIRVEPHKAVMEPDYFIKLIEQAEAKRTQEIERVEAGGLDSDEEAA